MQRIESAHRLQITDYGAMMLSINRGQRPLNILAVLTEGHAGLGMLSGFRAHYLLICRTVSQAIDSARSFGPDIVIVDQDLTDRNELLQSWRERADGCEPVFVSLSSAGPKGEWQRSHYQFAIILPASGWEVESLLSEIRSQLEVLPSLTLSSA